MNKNNGTNNDPNEVYEVKNHIELGHELKLFFFDPVSPGSCFFMPHGAKVHQMLIDQIRKYYRQNGYQEVVSPNIFDKKLWITSGHWDKYRENMFLINNKDINENDLYNLDQDECNVEKEGVTWRHVVINQGNVKKRIMKKIVAKNADEMEFSLKGMNCPGHCVIFDKMQVSYKQLPLRMAEFGVLHRNELSGSLRGLTRVRRFQQDDSHIFCDMDQIDGEIERLLKFIDTLYQELGCKYQIEVSTRPENFLGEISIWNRAEEILKNVVKRVIGAGEVVINEGDGAFYGPKIDISIQDSLDRWHQCGTIQLDFNLPERFKLTFVNEDGSLVRPVIIHRALLGSLERFMAIVLEHTQGKLPFWMSPRQVAVLAIKPEHSNYAMQIGNRLHQAGYEIETNISSDDLRQKIKWAELMRFNYIIVLGDREIEEKTIAVRNCRLNGKEGRKIITMQIEDFLEKLNKQNSIV